VRLQCDVRSGLEGAQRLGEAARVVCRHRW
jgi:hypothetical protein